MTLRVALRIEGDASGARRAVEQTSRDVRQLADEAGRAAPGLGAIEASARRAGISVEEYRQRMAGAAANVARIRAENAALERGHESAAAATRRHGAAEQQAGAQSATAAKQYRAVVEQLQHEEQQLKRSGKDRAVATALRQAGVSAASAEGRALAVLAARNHDLRAASEAAARANLGNNESIEKLARAASVAGGPLGGLVASTGALFVGSSRLGIGIVGLTVGLGALTLGATSAVGAYSRLETAQARATNALAATGHASGQTIESLERIAVAMGRVGTHSLADIRAAQQELLRFRDVSGSSFERVAVSAQALSNTFAVDLPTATTTLARAIANPIDGLDGLRQMGIKFRAEEARLIEQLYRSGQVWRATHEILRVIAEQTGGANATASLTLAAAWGRLTNAGSIWLEQTGREIAELLRLKAALDLVAGGVDEINRRRGTGFDASTFIAGPLSLPGAIMRPDQTFKAVRELMFGGGEAGAYQQAAKSAADYGAQLDVLFVRRERLVAEMDRSRAASRDEFDAHAVNARRLVGELDRLDEKFEQIDASRRRALGESVPTPIGKVRPPALSDEQEVASAKVIEALRHQAAAYGQSEAAAAKYMARRQALIAGTEQETVAHQRIATAIDQHVNAMLAAQLTRGVVDQARLQTAALRIEAATFGMSAGAAAAYKMEHEALARARIAGIELSPPQVAAIQAEARALGEATAAVERYRAAKAAADAVSGGVADAFYQWTTGAKSLSGAIDDLTKSLYRMALQAAIGGQGPLAGLFGTQPSGGVLGSLLTSAFGGTPTPALLPTSNLGYGGPTAGVHFAGGGFTGAGDPRAPAGIVHAGEYVFDADATRAIGVDTLEALRAAARNGYVGGGYVGPPIPPPPHRVVEAAMASAPPPPPPQVQIIIENHSGAPVSTVEESDGRGGRRTRVVIDEIVAGGVRPGSPAHRTLLDSLGMRQPPRRRG